MIWVKCIGIDDKGRVKLSRRAALKERAEQDGAGGAEGSPDGGNEGQQQQGDRAERQPVH